MCVCVSPLTGKPNVSLMEVLAVKPIIDRWQTRLGIDVTSEFHGITEFSKYRCNDTGLEFFSPTNIAASAAVYEQLQQFAWYYQRENWEHRIAVGDLPSGGRVLEVGCGAGSFVQAAAERGCDAIGTEFNPKAVAAARQAGRAVSAIKLGDFVPGSFDAVCAFQVLEHIAEPQVFLASCVALLKPGGRLILGVPNCDGYLRETMNELNLPPHHMGWWNEKCLRSLEGLFSLNLVRLEFEPLTEEHAEAWLAAFKAKTLRRSLLARRLLDKLPDAWQRTLALSAKGFLRGHTIYAIFRKQ